MVIHELLNRTTIHLCIKLISKRRRRARVLSTPSREALLAVISPPESEFWVEAVRLEHVPPTIVSFSEAALPNSALKEECVLR